MSDTTDSTGGADEPEATPEPPPPEPTTPAAPAATAVAPAAPEAASATEPTVNRHPIRGGLWGLMMGIGLALALIGFAVIAAGTLTPYVVTLGGVVVGVLWGFFAPAKSPNGPAPT